MTVVIERYTSNTGKHATIGIEKNCKSFLLTVSEPIGSGPFATTIFRNYYTTKKAAKQVMKRFWTGWERKGI